MPLPLHFGYLWQANFEGAYLNKFWAWNEYKWISSSLMNLDGLVATQHTWRVTADLVVLWNERCCTISVTSKFDLRCVAWLQQFIGTNWRAKWRSYHPVFLWVFFKGLWKGVLRFSSNYIIVKRNNLKLHSWKTLPESYPFAYPNDIPGNTAAIEVALALNLSVRDSGGTGQDTQQNNNSTKLSEPRRPKRVFWQINIRIYIYILLYVSYYFVFAI